MGREKNVVLGVTGGIAAYKAADIVSRLRKNSAAVRVIMTAAATHFISALTLRELSGNPVTLDMWSPTTDWNVEHIALAKWAEVFLIAPATANIVGKIANGIADDMLSTTVMATKAPVVLAPAMNSNMYLNPVTQANLDRLAKLGYIIIEPDCGRLACGDSGPGRLPEPAVIVDRVDKLFFRKQALAGQKILVTAGGTREPLDPVRYIGNRSSGKMGYALAKAAAARGAEVFLIAGPNSLPVPAGVNVQLVETAAEMRAAVLAKFPVADIVIKAAAVSDYRPRQRQGEKIKKSDGELTLVLESNPDILAELGQRKKNQFLVGFAAETQELVSNARRKLEKKNLDLIVANDITRPGAGFDTDTNIVKLLFRDGSIEDLPIMSKEALAETILDKIRR